MAAILCKALAQPCIWLGRGCDACCRGLSKVCSGLGSCCDAICRVMGDCCAATCAALGECCAVMARAFSKPFSGFVFVTLLSNLIPFAVLLGIANKQFNNDCSTKPLGTWLIICLVIFIINAMFAFYLWSRLSNAPPDLGNPAAAAGQANNNAGGNNNTHNNYPPYDPNVSYERNQLNRSMHFFMYDPVVCLYIVFYIFAFVWAIIGLSWASATNVCTAAGYPDLVSSVSAGAIILICFLIFALVIITCTLTTSYVTICLNDCDLLKCLFCCCYYPFMYDSERARQRYNQQHPQRQPLQQQQQAGQVVIGIPAQPVPVVQPQLHYQRQPVAQPVYAAQPQSQPQYQPQYHAQPQYQSPLQPQQQSYPTYAQQPMLHYQQPSPSPFPSPPAAQQVAYAVPTPASPPASAPAMDSPPPYQTPAFQPGMSSPYAQPVPQQQQQQQYYIPANNQPSPQYAQPVDHHANASAHAPGGPSDQPPSQSQSQSAGSSLQQIAGGAASALKSGVTSLTTWIDKKRSPSQQQPQQQQQQQQQQQAPHH